MRRHRFVAAVFTALTALVVVACGSTDTASTARVPINLASTAKAGQELNVSSDPQNGGTLHIAMSADPLCLDPHQISSDVEQLLGQMQFDDLTFLGKNGIPQPWLATSWTISPDQKTYTFTLKKGVTFADGTAFNAAAVVADFQQMLAASTRSPLAGPYIQPYTGSTIINPYKLEVHLAYPYSPFLYVLAQGWLGMESPKSLADDTPAELCQHPVGSGPFSLTSYTENVGATYVARTGYDWGPPELGQKGGPHIAQIDLSWVSQSPIIYDGLVSGQYQLTQYVPAADAPALEKNPNFVYENVNRIGWPFVFDFNTSRAPLNDVDVRKAIIEGVDVRTIVAQTQFGQHAIANSYLDSVTPYFDPSAKVPGYDLKAAQALLSRAGWRGTDSAGYRTNAAGKELDLYIPISNSTTISPIYDLLQAQLKANLGINLVYRLESAPQATTDRYDGNYDLLAGVWHTNTPDVLYIKYDSTQIPNAQHLGQNLAHLDDPTLDKILQDARETTNPAQLTKLYAQAQQRLVSVDYPGLPVYQNSVLWAFNKDVHNVFVNTSHGTPFLTYAWIGGSST